MREPTVVHRRRKWPLVAAVVVTLTIVWIGLWFVAASRVESTLAGWREHETRAGRIHSCAEQAIGGFPFWIEVHCTGPIVTFQREVSPLAISAAHLVAVAPVYAPTSLAARIEGPLTITQENETAQFVATWTAAEAKLHGTPGAPDFASLAADRLSIDRKGSGAANETVFRAERIELIARLVDGSAAADPVVDLSLQLAAAAAPAFHPLVAQSTDADIAGTVRGIPSLVPRSGAAWLEGLRRAAPTSSSRKRACSSAMPSRSAPAPSGSMRAARSMGNCR